MQIKEYLQSVYRDLQILKEKIETEKEGLPLLALSQDLSSKGLASYALELECVEFIKNLLNCFESMGHLETSSDNLICFKNFLETRWELIKGSELSYCYALTNPLTLICWELATKLRFYFSSHPLKLLMPTISEKNPVTLTTLLEDEEGAKSPLGLENFIVCDENKYLINVLDCMIFAIDDNKFKHTHALHDPYPGQPNSATSKLLTDNEKKRVINHSIDAQNLYQKIEEYHLALDTSVSIGATLKRLIRNLIEGSLDGQKRRTGIMPKNTNNWLPAAASEEAVSGVTEFYEYLRYLTMDERKKLFSLKSTNNYTTPTFELCWYHLLYHHHTFGYITGVPEAEITYINKVLVAESIKVRTDLDDDQLVIICVREIARDFEKMLNKSDLMDVFPVNMTDTSEIIVGPSRARVFNQQIEFSNVVAAKKCRMIKVDLKSLAPKSEETFIKKAFRKLVDTPTKLVHQLNSIPELLHHELLIKAFGLIYLKKICNTALSFAHVMSNAAIKNSIYHILGLDYVTRLVRDSADLLIISRCVNSADLSYLLARIGSAKIAKFFSNAQEVSQFKSDLSPELDGLLANYLPQKVESLRSLLNSHTLFSRRTKRRTPEIAVENNWGMEEIDKSESENKKIKL